MARYCMRCGAELSEIFNLDNPCCPWGCTVTSDYPYFNKNSSKETPKVKIITRHSSGETMVDYGDATPLVVPEAFEQKEDSNNDMNDLIRRSDVLKLLSNLKIDNISVNDKRLTKHIKDIPVAFSIDNIEKELDRETRTYLSGNGNMTWSVKAIEKKKVINIIRGRN